MAALQDAALPAMQMLAQLFLNTGSGNERADANYYFGYQQALHQAEATNKALGLRYRAAADVNNKNAGNDDESED